LLSRAAFLLLGTLLAASVLAAPASARPAARFRIIDLGTLGGANSQALAVNNHGQVVGTSDVRPGSEDSHAFLWADGRMRDLGTFGGPISAALDINDHGQVVGAADTASFVGHAFLWAHGRMRDLGTLGGTFSVATGINDQGVVSGYSATPSGATHAFLWRDGHMNDLGLGDSSTANDLNNHGQIVGGYPSPLGGFHAYRWQHGAATPIDTQSNYSEAFAINARGQAAGWAGFPGSDFFHAALFSHGQTIDLGTLAGAFSKANGIDHDGRVVGQSDSPTGPLHAFLWQGGRMTDLGALSDQGMNGGSSANDINDHGLIAGSSAVTTGDSAHAVLWRG